MKKKLGIGSISLLLIILALVWGCTVNGFCLGDHILELIGLYGCLGGCLATMGCAILIWN